MPELKISGGAEQQLSILAGLLVKNGYEVIFFCGDFDQPDFVREGNMCFYKFERKTDGRPMKVLRFVQLLRKIRPHYVLERGASMFTALTAISCKVLRIPFVFCGASDINFAKNEIDPFFGNSKIKQRLYQWSLRHVQHFVVQKRKQAMLLKQNFGIVDNVSLIRNFQPDVTSADACNEKIFDAVWVANLIPYKQPELFIELARSNPDQNFLLIGATADKNYNDKIGRLAQTVSNLKAIGYVPPTKVIDWVRKSKIIVNTTKIASGYEEGFSNVLLIGWMSGLPTLTLISDPDDVIVSNRMGFRSGTFSSLCADFKTLMCDVNLCKEMGSNAVAYVNRHHNKNIIFQEYLRIFGNGASTPVSSSRVLVQ